MQSVLLDVETGDTSDVSNKSRLDSLDARAMGIETRLTGIEARLGIAIPERKSTLVKFYERVVNNKGTTIAIAIIAIFGSVFGSSLYRRHLEHQDRDFNNSVDGRIEAKLVPVGTKLDGVTQRLATVEGKLDVLILQRAAAQPNNPNSAGETSQVLQEARKNGAKLDVGVVEQSGKAFIGAAVRAPSAWNVALDFLNYRSTLNVYVRSVGTVKVPAGSHTNFDIGPVVAGKPLPEVLHLPAAVAPKDAARFEKLGQNLNKQLQFGSAQLLLVGGAVSLDDKYVRHAVFEGVEIHYTGRPLILQNTVFVNCTFVLANTQPGRQLGQVLLASSPVNFEKAS